MLKFFKQRSKCPKTRLIYYSNYYYPLPNHHQFGKDKEATTPCQLITRALQMAMSIDSLHNTTTSSTTSTSTTVASASASAAEKSADSKVRVWNVVRVLAIKTASLLDWNLLLLEKEYVNI